MIHPLADIFCRSASAQCQIAAKLFERSYTNQVGRGTDMSWITRQRVVGWEMILAGSSRGRGSISPPALGQISSDKKFQNIFQLFS